LLCGDAILEVADRFILRQLADADARHQLMQPHELRTLCLFGPSHRPCERKLTQAKANQPEACHLYALLGMAPEVVHVNCGVSAAPKQKEQQPDPVLARDSNHFTSVLRRLFGQGSERYPVIIAQWAGNGLSYMARRPA